MMQTILVVDDTKVNLEVIDALLSKDYTILTAINATGAFEILGEHQIDLILLDIIMPTLDGFGVCRLLKNNKRTREIPIIFLTAADDENSIEKAYVIGGSDYVTKPFRPKELKARVKRELQIQKLQKDLMELATTDPLTNLYNRRYFSSMFHELYQQASTEKRKKYSLVLMLFDIDHFKSINDTHGHSVGDKVIIHFANHLVDYERRGDVVARYGGEEFVVLLSNIKLSEAQSLANTIRKDISIKPLEMSEQSIHYTASIGMTEVRLDVHESLEEALNRADEALYEAKKSGRNLVVTI